MQLSQFIEPNQVYSCATSIFVRPAFALRHAHILEVHAGAFVGVGQSGATTFRPPLLGRDRERGGGEALRQLENAPGYLWRKICWIVDMTNTRRCSTPLPVPPPQGGRERCGAHLRTSH